MATDEGFVLAQEYRATWKHMLPPSAGHGAVKLTEEARIMADRLAAIAEHQVDLGDHFTLEARLESPTWNLPSLKRLAQKPGVQQILLDRCAYGGPALITVKVMHNAPWLPGGRRCFEAPNHRHCKDKSQAQGPKGADESPMDLYEEWAMRWKEWRVSDKGRTAEKNTGKDAFVRLGKFQNKIIRAELVRDDVH